MSFRRLWWMGGLAVFALGGQGACSGDPSDASRAETGGATTAAAGGTSGADTDEPMSGGGHTEAGGSGGTGSEDEGAPIAFFLGQDTGTLEAFAAAVLDSPSAHVRVPDGVTLYTALLPTGLHENSAPDGTTLYLSGIEGPPADEGNGTVDFAATLERYDALAEKKVALAVGLYLSDSWAECSNQPLRSLIARGDADLGAASDPSSLIAQWRGGIDRLIEWLDAQDREVLLRIGYEFDGPWNCYNQDFYKAAFRYVKERIDALGAMRIATVWQAATYPDDGDPAYHYQVTGGPTAPDLDAAIQGHYESWYPGDDVVDVIGVSFFSGSEYESYQWSCEDASKPWTVPETSPRKLQDALAEFARDHEKSLVIAESAPQGFDLAALTHSCVAARQDQKDGRKFASGAAAFDAFFVDYFDWMRDNADVVSAFSYIDTNWQAQTRWACAAEATACAQGYWGDTRLEASPDVLTAFYAELSAPPFAAE